jgi:hypothetical protein
MTNSLVERFAAVVMEICEWRCRRGRDREGNCGVLQSPVVAPFVWNDCRSVQKSQGNRLQLDWGASTCLWLLIAGFCKDVRPFFIGELKISEACALLPSLRVYERGNFISWPVDLLVGSISGSYDFVCLFRLPFKNMDEKYVQKNSVNCTVRSNVHYLVDCGSVFTYGRWMSNITNS